MPNPLEPEVEESAKEAKPVRLTKEGKPFREQRRGKIDALPDEVRGELDSRLATNSYRSYSWLSRWLEEEHSARISPSAINYRKKHKLDLKLLPVKYATEEARAIVEATGGDNEEINRVLTTLVQTKLYEMLVQMNTVIAAFDMVESAQEQGAKIHAAREKTSAAMPADGAENESLPDGTQARRMPSKAALTAVAALIKGTAVIGHHVREGEKWDLERDIKLSEQIEAANQKVVKVVREGGLSPEAEEKIRNALMEIKL
jgi:hypothetical protein